MLQSRNLSAVLSQVIQRQQTTSHGEYPKNSIVSSILITKSGQPVASYHTNRVPPPPHTVSVESTPVLGPVSSGSDHYPASSKNTISSTSSINETSHPYHVNRSMKTKVYALLASSIWNTYQKLDLDTNGSAPVELRREPGVEDANFSNSHDWICVKTEDATQILIKPVNLPSTASQLLLVLVADEGCPLGLLLKKSQETVNVLEEGLHTYKVNE